VLVPGILLPDGARRVPSRAMHHRHREDGHGLSVLLTPLAQKLSEL
jgi:hypothetical protein